MAVSPSAGSSALNLMLSGAYSTASPFVVVLTAPLLVPYQTIFGRGRGAEVLERLMKLPPFPYSLK